MRQMNIAASEATVDIRSMSMISIRFVSALQRREGGGGGGGGWEMVSVVFSLPFG